MSAARSTRSIQGVGTTTIDVSDDASVVSANAQKQVANGEMLIVQILKGGEVVKETSTGADYGVARVSESFFFRVAVRHDTWLFG